MYQLDGLVAKYLLEMQEGLSSNPGCYVYYISQKIICSASTVPMEMDIKVTNRLALINLFPVGCMLGVTQNVYFIEWWPGTILFPVVQIK
jgi:hypothetical protein